MHTALTARSVPVLAPGHRLQWEQAQQAHVLLYPEGMVTLNESARAILHRCDGSRSLAQIVEDLQQTFGEPDLSGDVTEFLAAAAEEGWIRVR